MVDKIGPLIDDGKIGKRRTGYIRIRKEEIVDLTLDLPDFPPGDRLDHLVDQARRDIQSAAGIDIAAILVETKRTQRRGNSKVRRWAHSLPAMTLAGVFLVSVLLALAKYFNIILEAAYSPGGSLAFVKSAQEFLSTFGGFARTVLVGGSIAIVAGFLRKRAREVGAESGRSSEAKSGRGRSSRDS